MLQVNFFLSVINISCIFFLVFLFTFNYHKQFIKPLSVFRVQIIPLPLITLVFSAENGFSWKRWGLNLCGHACLPADHPSVPVSSSNGLQCIHSGQTDEKPSMHRVSLHRWRWTIPWRAGGGGVGFITHRQSEQRLYFSYMSHFSPE